MNDPDLIAKHRRYLPHVQLKRQVISITWRLAFTLPRQLQELLHELRVSLQSLHNADETSLSERYEEYAYKLERYDDYLGRFQLQGLSLCEPAIGSMMRSALHFYDHKLYQLHTWCLMPNHVHLLVQPLPLADGTYAKISTIVQRIKGYTAKQINLQLGRSGKVWNDDYYDRFIRNSRDYCMTVEYVMNNPVKAGLTDRRESWEYAYFKAGLID